MSNATTINLTNGVPTGPSGAATVSTLDNLVSTAGSPSANVLSVQGVSGGEALPVSLASNQSVNLAQISGSSPGATNALPVSQVTNAGAGGVASTYRLLSAAAGTNATSVKASAGRLYQVLGYNAATALRYLKLYNKASAPTVGTDTPVKTIPLPPACAFVIDHAALGYYFSTGIAFALTVNVADSDTTSLSAGDVLALNLDYA
jgi:hypothetical protein